MADFFRMPTLGQTMEEGTILQWFKQEGDYVKKGDILLEVMSDKANFEVEAEQEGVLRRILTPANSTVPVNEPIAIIGDDDEPMEALLSRTETAGQAPVTADPAAMAASGPAPEIAAQGEGRTAGLPEGERILVSPRARRLADARGIPVAALRGLGTGPGGRVLERDVLTFLKRSAEPPAGAKEEARPRVTPLAAKIANDLGVDVEQLALGLPGSRVTAEDVRRYAETPQPSPTETPALVKTEPAGGPAVAERIPFRGLRKLIADNVAKSRQTAPHVTLTLEVDMTELAAVYPRLQAEIQKTYNTKLTYTDLLVKAAARALADHPLCNAALLGDEIRVYADRNVGVAVATDNGLIVPVIKQADTKPVGAISVELKAMAERCRSGKQTPEDLAGGTFTITNLGAFGIDVFDPILVPPQSCILGVGRIAEKPVVVNHEVTVRSMMNLCLSFDHRVLDGVPAARFLQRMKELLESPLMIFI